MAAERPYVTVVIPTYNRAPFIGAAIESVLAQQGSEWPVEIVVVDDGSTDETEQAVQPYGNSIRYRRIAHSGLPAVARNVGVRAAQGELIAFLDSDDLWVPDKLTKQVPLFDDPHVVLSYGQAHAISGRDTTPGAPVVDPAKLDAGEEFRSLLVDNVISTLTTIVRRSAVEALGGFDESPDLRGVEDYEFWLRVAARYPRGIVSLPSSLAFYRLHGDGLGSTDSATALRRLVSVYDRLWLSPFLTAEQRLALEAQSIAMHENWSRQRVLDGDVPAVSVVMSIYRDKRFVAQAVQSILDQTFRDFELVVVDDGSEDGSYEVVAAFDDPRIRIVRQTNHGLVGALNTGVRVARASLIARQDADDISLPGRLEREMAYMATDPGCAVVGTFFSYVEESSLEPTGVTITSVTKHLDIVRHMYFDNPIGHGTALVRRSAILDVGGYSDAFGPNEDYDLWRRLVADGGEVAIIPEVLYHYRLNSSGISSRRRELQHRLFAELVETIWEGPLHVKTFWQIVADNRYYKRLDSPFRTTVHGQYKHHQFRLAGAFLSRRHFRSGLHTFVGALLIAPLPGLRLGIALFGAYVRAAARRTRRVMRGR